MQRLSKCASPSGESAEASVNLTFCLTLLGCVLILCGGGLTLFVVFSGTWGLGHGYPILILGVPLLMIGLFLLWFPRRTKRI
jgi:hypothetical protein